MVDTNQTSKTVEVTVKVIHTKKHMGSSETTGRRLPKMSKAAGKFNALLGTKVSLSNGQPDSESNNTQIDKDTNVDVKTLRISVTVAEAAVAATLICNAVEGSERSTEAFIQAKANFDTQRKEVLSSLGATDYDELTREQKQVYARQMVSRRAPFDYYTSKIHIKCKGNPTVKTVTLYGLKPRGVEGNINKILNSLKDNMSRYNVTVVRSAVGSSEVNTR